MENVSCGTLVITSARATGPSSPSHSLGSHPAAKHSIDTGAGVIDVDYRGPLKVILFNLSDVDFSSASRPASLLMMVSKLTSVAPGDRIAQLILEEVRMAPAVEVDNLDETERGHGGFGSTGGFGPTV